MPGSRRRCCVSRAGSLEEAGTALGPNVQVVRSLREEQKGEVVGIRWRCGVVQKFVGGCLLDPTARHMTCFPGSSMGAAGWQLWYRM
jgi:hypothetical protein